MTLVMMKERIIRKVVGIEPTIEITTITDPMAAIDLEGTINHVTEITETMTMVMVADGKAIGITAIMIGETRIKTTAKPRMAEMMAVTTETIGEMNQEERERTSEAEGVMVMEVIAEAEIEEVAIVVITVIEVTTEVIIVTIIGDVGGTMVAAVIVVRMKVTRTRRRTERFIFRQMNQMMRIIYLETTCRWE